MVKITLINGETEILLHHYSEATDSPKINSAVMKQELNTVSTCILDIPYGNDGFNEFVEFKSHIKIEDKEGKELFFGRMINPKDSLNSGLSRIIFCEGELAYLNDSTIRPREWHDTSVKDFLRDVLEEHNKQVEDYKKIYLGNVTVSETLYRMANYDSTLTFLIDRLPNRIGGFFQLRKVNGIKYLDYLLDIGKQSKQEIIFGENMLDFEVECQATGIYTKVIPLGKDITDGTGESPVGNRLTIADVNNGIDYLINEDAVKAYGLLETKKIWDDVTIADNLKRKGEEYLKSICTPRRALKMNIVDMNNINKDIEKLYIGDKIRVVCKPFSVDENFRINKASINFLDPKDCTYEFANKFGKMTDKQIIVKNSQEKLQEFFNENGLKSQFLDGTINLLQNSMRAMVDVAKKHNELAILFECREQGEFFGAMAIGTKGFMIADELNPDDTWNWRTFGTAKGLVADMIITGILSAVTIMNADGSFEIDLSKTGGANFKMNNKLALQMKNFALNFFDFEGNGNKIGAIQTKRYKSIWNNNIFPTMQLMHNKDGVLAICYEDQNGNLIDYAYFDYHNISGAPNHVPIKFLQTVAIGQLQANIIRFSASEPNGQLLFNKNGVDVYGSLNVRGTISGGANKSIRAMAVDDDIQCEDGTEIWDLDGIEKLYPKNSGGNTDVVNQARRLIGLPYSQDYFNYLTHNIPPYCDCSSLCQWSYYQIGKTISRTTYTQIREGVEVAQGDVQPGDMIFSNFSSPGVPEHVFLYSKFENGQHYCVEASTYGVPCRERAFNFTGDMRIRRMV